MILPLESKLEPEITGEVFDAIAKDKQWQAIELARCAEEPWYWLVNYIWTREKVLQDNIPVTLIRRIPPKEYLRLICQDWYENPFYALSKSRQMIATWLITTLHLHACIFSKDIHVFCQSQKSEDADLEMIQRADFMFRNMPVWMRKFNPERYSFCKLKFPKNESFMQAIPEGGDQIRSHNPNYLMSDEIAFQPAADDAYTAALACCLKITFITSPNPGWACDFYNDTLAA